MAVYGGQFPSGKEANFYRPDPGSTRYCIENWTSPAIFCGWEAGNLIRTGGEYLRKNLRPNNPVYLAYQMYNSFAGRPAWDQLAVMLLDEPRANLYLDVISDGHLSVANDGSNCWKSEKLAGKDHSYIRIRDAENPATIARYMDDLVIGLQSN